MGKKIFAKLFDRYVLTTVSNRQNKVSLINYRYSWWQVWPTVATHVESCELHTQMQSVVSIYKAAYYF